MRKPLSAFLIPVVFFALVEALIRIAFPGVQPQGTDRSIVSDQLYGSSSGLKPNSEGECFGVKVSVNSYGFRATRKPVDEKRECWLHVGDSVTLGIGVADDSTFSARMHAEQDSVNVVNLSWVGYSTADYANAVNSVLFNSGLNYSRVTVFYCLNDVYSSHKPQDVPGSDLRTLLGPILIFLKQHSRLYVGLKKMFFDRPKTYYEYDAAFYDGEPSLLDSAIQDLKKTFKICATDSIQFDVVLLPYE